MHTTHGEEEEDKRRGGEDKTPDTADMENPDSWIGTNGERLVRARQNESRAHDGRTVL